MYIDISSDEIDTKLKDEKAIGASVNNILFTKLGELPGLPDFGSRLFEFVFELADFELEYMFKKEIEYVLAKWEPRITVQDVDIILDTDYNRVQAKIKYYLTKDIRDDNNSKFISFTMNRR